MPFPETPRVLYLKNPLEEVICQLRFPPILRIASELPVGYQERIRHQYPLFQDDRSQVSELPISAEVAKRLGIDLGSTVAYEFMSPDGDQTVTLARDFLALTSRNYERWEAFWQQLAVPLQALQDEYSPAFFTRLGLRYRNVIRRSALGLSTVPWADLIRPYLVGVLALPDVEPYTQQAKQQSLILLRGVLGQVRINNGSARDPETDEDCYVIDSDFFTDERTETKHAGSTLGEFNRKAGHLFRWCIEDQLHAAMVPQAI
jgi:uncharacterized protein (TIGR04255 family)